MMRRLEPWDEHNQTLVERVHPADWVNPIPMGRYNLVAIGGGTAGIICAMGAAGLGGKAAIIERNLLGGDCLNYGCVPSKAILSAARVAQTVRDAGKFGAKGAEGVEFEFARVMERMRRTRAGISRHDSAKRLSEMGVDVFLGQAHFSGKDAIRVGDRELSFHRAVIATGGSPAVPDIPGLRESSFFTNETVFSLTELPKRWIVLGAGPIGLELGQAFRRFGAEVTVIGRNESALGKEEPEAAAVVTNALAREGVRFRLGWRATTVESEGAERPGNGPTKSTRRLALTIERDGQTESIEGDAILVATGRVANTSDLRLDLAGVSTSNQGVEVDDFLRTSNPSVFAAGDVCSAWKFTHAADAMARVCLRNALFRGRERMSRQVIPRCTYTDPELACVGKTSAELMAEGAKFITRRVDFARVDRAVIEGQDEGFAQVELDRRSGRLLGGTIVGAHAGELIGQLTILMTRRLPLEKLADVITCYPTRAEALKRLADEQARSRLTPRIARLFRAWLAWRL